MLYKYSLFTILTLILCLLVTAPSFAFDDSTDNITSNDSEVLQVNHYYFDVNNTEDGNGSMDNPFNQINSNNLVDNSIVHLASGEYYLQSSKSFKNITFTGISASVLNFNNYTLTNSKTLNINNITVKNANIINSGILTASKVTFKDSGSVSKDFGGIIYSSGHDIYLYDCVFKNNTAKYGGVIYIFNAKLEINNTIFENNNALIFGGVITAVKSHLKLNNITARNNKANYEGGVVYSLFGDFSIINSTLNNNTARNGGALYIDNNTCAIFINNTFTNNSAIKLAGAIYSLTNSNTTFKNNTLTNNDLLNTSIPTLVIGNNNYTMYVYNQTVIENLPDSYNLKDYGYVSSIKTQGSGGNCWSFALLAALESCILKAGGEEFDLSEGNVKNLMALYSDYGWNLETNKGGKDDMGVAYLISWLGPVFESDDPYSPTSILSPVLNSILHIQNVLFIKRDNFTDNDGIKMAILQYGAVATAIKWSGSSVKGNARYYSGNGSSDHAVAIVGWDDNYSRDNFANKPAGDGAWIIKNSHGFTSGDNGYWYVSYYDVRCAQVGRNDVSFTFILNDTIHYDKNYQYDIQGRTDFFLNESSTVWYKNIFTSTDDEYLAAVSTHFEKATNYTIYINVNNQLKHTQNGSSKSGYFTINLNEMVPLQKGDVFEVIFKITTDGEAAFPISEKVSLNKCFYTENISFYSYDGENWIDMYNVTWKYSTHTYNSQMASIKAFTVLDIINSTVNLTYNFTNVVTITAEVLNQYGHHIVGGKAIFDVNGKKYTVDVKNGIAKLVLKRGAYKYNVNVTFQCAGYNSSSNNFSFEIEYDSTNITLNISREINPVNFTVIVYDSDKNIVLDGNVTLIIDEEISTQSIVNGSVCVSKIFDSAGLHNITVYYNGSEGYYKSNTTQSFIVLIKNTSIEVKMLNEYNPVNMEIKVIDEFGDYVQSGEIICRIDSTDYNIIFDNYTAYFTHTFLNSINSLDINYIGDYHYYSSYLKYDFDVKSTIISFDANKALNSKYTATFLNSTGNPLVESVVSFTINSKTYTVKTDENGQAQFNINLAVGSYSVIISNPTTTDTKTQLINVVARISKNNDVVMYWGANGQYNVRVCDDDGVYKSGLNVLFTLSNKNYNIITDSNGYATLKVNLDVGTYTVYAQYNGYVVSNKITIKKTLITKNIVVKKGKIIKFTAKLLNSKGKVLKSKKVSFKFKGKTYKVKTNSKGIATLKITKKYKAGKYTITTSYSKLKVKNTIKIKR